MERISIPFVVSKEGKISEEVYLPRLLLEVESNKEGGGLLKKSGELVKGIAELAIPMLVSFYEKRERGILVLHEVLAQKKKTLYFPELIALDDLDTSGSFLEQPETDYDAYTKEFSALISSITEIKKNALELDTLPSKDILDDLKKFMAFAYEKEATNAFFLDTDFFETNQEIQELHKMLDHEEDKLSKLPSKLEGIQVLAAEKAEVLKRNLEEDCNQIMGERTKKRRETIDAFKIKAAEIKQLKRDNAEDEKKLLSARMDRRKTVEFHHNQARDALSKTSGEEQEQLKNSITEYRNQLMELDKEIQSIKAKAESRRKELHSQLLALDEKMENFDNETESIKYEYKKKMQNLDHLIEQFQDAKEAYVINAKNELIDRINNLSVTLPLPDVSKDIQGPFFVYISVYIVVFKDVQAGTQRYMVLTPKYTAEETKTFTSSLLTKFKKTALREGFDILLNDSIPKALLNDKELELKVLEYISTNSILDSSSDIFAAIKKGSEKLKKEGKISEKEFRIIKSMMEGKK